MDTNKKSGGSNRSGTRIGAKIAYLIAAVLTGLSYWSIQPFIITQEPIGKEIIVSNLTLNYVLFALLVGALVPSVTRRLFPKAFKRMLIPMAIVMGILLILILRTLGVEMRF